MNHHVAIIGNRIAANQAACYLRKTLPEVAVTIIGPEVDRAPVVGESLTEYSTQFFFDIGLRECLEKEHLPKHGLTFYFKGGDGTAAAPRYAMHEVCAVPPLPSALINRFTFDVSLKRRADELGAERITGQVKRVERTGGGWRLTCTTPEGRREVNATWVIDASGRSRVLQKAFGLQARPACQRGTYWMRIAGFDRGALMGIPSSKDRQVAFDSYYATHHFMGRGNWIWVIPMTGVEGDDRDWLSIGITYRPDLIGCDPIRTRDDWFRQVRAEHPGLAAFVDTAEIIDDSVYLSYMYDSKQLYSRDGWFMIGDSSGTVDPLYSTGLVMNSLQSEQVTEMIRRDIEGRLDEAMVARFERGFRAIREGMQLDVSAHYGVMEEPVASSVRMHLATAAYFYFLLPSWLSKLHVDDRGIEWVRGFLHRTYLENWSLNRFAAEVGARERLRADEIRNWYEHSVNWRIFTARPDTLREHVAALNDVTLRIREDLVRRARGRTPLRQRLAVLRGRALQPLLPRMLEPTGEGRGPAKRLFDAPEPHAVAIVRARTFPSDEGPPVVTSADQTDPARTGAASVPA